MKVKSKIQKVSNKKREVLIKRGGIYEVVNNTHGNVLIIVGEDKQRHSININDCEIIEQ